MADDSVVTDLWQELVVKLNNDDRLTPQLQGFGDASGDQVCSAPSADRNGHCHRLGGKGALCHGAVGKHCHQGQCTKMTPVELIHFVPSACV